MFEDLKFRQKMPNYIGGLQAPGGIFSAQLFKLIDGVCSEVILPIFALWNQSRKY